MSVAANEVSAKMDVSISMESPDKDFGKTPTEPIIDAVNKRRGASGARFSKLLCKLMEDHKMTVRQAAQIASVGSSTIASWRSGAMPEDFVAVKRLAAALRVSLSYLLTGEDEAPILNQNPPSIHDVFRDGGDIFDGYARIRIERLVPKNKKGDSDVDS